jgi:prevent-host-death family protein
MSKKKIEIAAGKFKAQCLQLMDDVEKNKIQITITKRGKAVARLVPIDDQAVDLFGYLKGEIEILGDIIEPLEDKWEADG